MVTKFSPEKTTYASSFKLVDIGVGKDLREYYAFSSNSIQHSLKQEQGRNNRKVVFVTLGESPFKMSGSRFLLPDRYALIKDTSKAQYPVRRMEESDEAYRQYLDNRKKEFLHLLTSTNFYNGETEKIEAMTNELAGKRKSVFLNWIQQLFLDYIDDANVEVCILNLMRLYTYDELAPASQMIALAARDMENDRVKDAAFSLFGHWGDARALKLLEAYDKPKNPWMAMKYETLINDIKRYAFR